MSFTQSKTDYGQVAQKIEALLADTPGEYEECTKQLRSIMTDDFKSLHPDGNPVLLNMNNWAKQQLAFIIVEYSGFSNEAIHMLLDALIRDHDWELLRKEILHNIEEERGQETKGIPHLEMMRQGYRVDLGLETDHINYSSVTDDFISKMRDIFKHDDNAFSAGALLAFEGTAIDEFHVIDEFIRKFQEMKGENLKKGSLTNLYIDGHKYFEIGHEDGLKQAIAPYINKENSRKFAQGYLTCCMTMSIWWDKLALEAYYRYFRHKLSVFETEVFDVGEVFS